MDNKLKTSNAEKYYYVYTTSIANQLIVDGYPIHHVERDVENRSRVVFAFLKTAEVMDEIKDLTYKYKQHLLPPIIF